MKEQHIIELIENASPAQLSERELERIEAHVGECQECRRAYQAAHLSALLLAERAAQTFEPPPFFQTRVVAALRDRRAANDSFSFKRLWNATGALVSSMAATVAALAVLTFYAPDTQPSDAAQQMASASNIYSAEEVLFDESASLEEQMSYDQVLTSLYESDEGKVR